MHSKSRMNCSDAIRWWLVCLCLGMGSVGGAREMWAQHGGLLNTGLGDQTSNAGQRGVEPRVTIDVDDMEIKDVLSKIVRQAGLALSWSNAKVPLTGNVTVKLKDVPVGTALAIVLKDQNAEAQMSATGRTVLVVKTDAKKSDGRQQEVGSISGRVVDSATGVGIPGATVTIEGTKIAVTTDAKGGFAIGDVAVGTRAIAVKVVGYRAAGTTMEVKRGTNSGVVIAMSVSSAMLSEVITTASGKQRRMEVGNDITVINVDSVMQTAPISSVTDLLDNRVPGLTIDRSSGSPGDPAKIRIRGEGSITRSSEPVIIVDGIRINSDERLNRDIVGVGGDPLNQSRAPIAGKYFTPSLLDQIDPNSIETIEVQKGPAASALYGADAANGVIIITTKRGGIGATKWQLRFSQGISYVPGEYANNYAYFGHGVIGYDERNDQACSYPCKRIVYLDSVVAFQALNDSRYSPISRGNDSRISTTVSGGRNTFGYSITGSTSSTLGYLRLPQIEIQRFALFHDRPLPGWAKKPEQYTDWQMNTSFTLNPTDKTYVAITQSMSGSKQTKSSLTNNAISELRIANIDTSQLGPEGIFQGTPFVRAQSRSVSSRTTGNMNWQATSWLPLTGTMGLDAVNRNDQRALPRGYWLAGSSDSLGYFNSGSGSYTTQSLSLGVGAGGIRLPIRGAKALRLLSGVSVTKTSNAIQTASADSLSIGSYSPSRIDGGAQQLDSRIVAGWYVEPRLDVQSRFFVVPGIRFDGSNAAGSKGGLSSFPRLSFSWIASEESFWPLKDAVDLFRVRMALGYAGRLPSSGDHLRLLAYSGSQINGNPADLLSIRSIGNTRLVPERTKEAEVGFDTEFWKNRINFGVTYSYGMTFDAIVPLVVAPSVLGSEISQPYNIGNVQKRSIEMSLQAQIIEGRKFGWNVATQFGKSSNEITSLGGSDIVCCTTNGGVYKAGYPIDAAWYTPVLRYADVNGNGVLDNIGEVQLADSAVFVGTSSPDFELSASSSMAAFNGRVNVYATFKYSNGLLRRSVRTSALAGCVYCASDHPGIMSLTEQAAFLNINPTIPQVVDVLTFSTMSINYNVPGSLLKRFGVTQTSIAIQGNNLGEKTNHRGKDPNEGFTPLPRSWRCSIQLGL